jgi:predicted esterase
MNSSPASPGCFLRGWRCLLALAGLLLPVLLSGQTPAAPRPFPPSLQQQAQTAYDQKAYATAAVLYARWLEASPRDVAALYNLACCYALVGDKVRSLEALDRAVDAGYRDLGHVRQDPDLAAVRNEARFATIVARLEKLQPPPLPAWAEPKMIPMLTEGAMIVILPEDYERSTRQYPVCVLLHGAGGNELQFVSFAAERLGRRDVIYVAVRAPHPDFSAALETGQTGFTALPPGDLVEASAIRERARKNYADWIIDAATSVQRTYRAKPGKVYLLGFSQGAAYAGVTALLHPDKVASYFAIATGALHLDLATGEALDRLRQEAVRPWLVHGRTDKVASVATSTTTADILRRASIQVELRLFDGGHEISPAVVAIATEWLNKEVRFGR